MPLTEQNFGVWKHERKKHTNPLFETPSLAAKKLFSELL